MDILTKSGVPRETAQGLSDKISEGIRQELSGLMVYTPKAKESTKERNEKIKQLYDEGLLSHAQLALRFDVSIRQIYRILK
jgi:Mor family transcriptional regulator